MSYRFEESYIPLTETRLEQAIQEEIFYRKVCVWFLLSLTILASMIFTTIWLSHIPTLINVLLYTIVSAIISGILTQVIATFFNHNKLRKVALKRLLGGGAEYVR